MADITHPDEVTHPCGCIERNGRWYKLTKLCTAHAAAHFADKPRRAPTAGDLIEPSPPSPLTALQAQTNGDLI